MNNDSRSEAAPVNWSHLFDLLRDSHRSLDGTVDALAQLEESRRQVDSLGPGDIDVTVRIGLAEVRLGADVLDFPDAGELIDHMAMQLQRSLIAGIADLHDVTTQLRGGAAQLELQLNAVAAAESQMAAGGPAAEADDAGQAGA
jgi:hypothetical protein